MNIILIGMSGVGKTFFGKKISEKLNMNFIDTDDILVGNLSGTQEFLEKVGEDVFLELEEKTILNLNDIDNYIIATGGSVVYSEKGMQHLKNLGKIIWLNDSLENLIKRGNIEERGIIGMKNKSYEELYKERLELYKKFSDIFIENPSEEKVFEVISQVKN